MEVYSQYSHDTKKAERDAWQAAEVAYWALEPSETKTGLDLQHVPEQQKLFKGYIGAQPHAHAYLQAWFSKGSMWQWLRTDPTFNSKHFASLLWANLANVVANRSIYVPGAQNHWSVYKNEVAHGKQYIYYAVGGWYALKVIKSLPHPILGKATYMSRPSSIVSEKYGHVPIVTSWFGRGLVLSVCWGDSRVLELGKSVVPHAWSRVWSCDPTRFQKAHGYRKLAHRRHLRPLRTDMLRACNMHNLLTVTHSKGHTKLRLDMLQHFTYWAPSVPGTKNWRFRSPTAFKGRIWI
jgi:hypothetical protein